MKKLYITLGILILLALGWFFYPRTVDVLKPSGENVSGGYTLPDPCLNKDCNIGK